MSITSTTKSRSIGAKIALVPVLSLGLLGGSMAIAGPASADYDKKISGCTVKAEKPSHEKGTTVNFKISIKCDDGKKRTVKVQQRRFEKDNGPDTRLGKVRTFERHFDRNDHHKTINSRDYVPRHLDHHDGEEVYHEVRFAVKYDNGKWSSWSDYSKWKESPVRYDINGRSR
ncbi:hypothetical protein [Arthrobacter sp. Z4-13]